MHFSTMHFWTRPLVIVPFVTVLAGAAARADVIVLDDTTPGTVYDAILDGAFVPPSTTIPADGIPDSQGNNLAVALGTVELRGIAEFPLAPLAGLGSTDIASAVLTFKIDDVISTFWPGLLFDNTAAETIFVFAYSGNGTVELGDFNNVVGAPVGIVDTTPFGVITDATLAVTGALAFTVDLTASLKTLLDAGATHIGLVFATNDPPTATSLDNLGVTGAQMPFITVTTVAQEPPSFDKPRQLCQRTLAKEGRKVANVAHTQLQLCFDRVIRDHSAGKDLGSAQQSCAKGLDLSGADSSKVAGARAKALAKMAKKCAGLVPADINSPCDAAAATMEDVASCVLVDRLRRVQEMVRAAYRDACGIVSAVALDAQYPALCSTP
jgi:hypothetical protein